MEKGWIKKATSKQKLQPEQRYFETETKEIRSVQWSITGLCNAKCRHCYITSSQNRHKDLSTEKIIEVLDKLAEQSILQVSVTGGEPLLRPDLPEILKAMSERHMKITNLSTNGFLLSEQVLDMFTEYGMKPYTQISFDGVGMHDWMRNVKGAEKMAVNAMINCREKNIPFVLSMCIHNKNLKLINDTVQLAASVGAKGIRIAMTGETEGDYQKSQGIEIPTFSDLATAYLDYLPVFVKEKPDLFLELCGFIKLNGKKPEGYTIIPTMHSCTDIENNRICSTIDRSFYISSDGKVLPCMLVGGSYLEEEGLKLSEHSLEECMNSPVYKKFLNLTAKRLVDYNNECKNCEFIKQCGCGCRAASLMTHGSLYETDKKRCEFFKNRWHEKIREVMDRCLREE